MNVIAEQVRLVEGREYITVTGLEDGPSPLLQLVDYGLRQEEGPHKGKLVGKRVKIKIESVRAIFSGRPQLTGRILECGSNGK